MSVEVGGAAAVVWPRSGSSRSVCRVRGHARADTYRLLLDVDLYFAFQLCHCGGEQAFRTPIGQLGDAEFARSAQLGNLSSLVWHVCASFGEVAKARMKFRDELIECDSVFHFEGCPFVLCVGQENCYSSLAHVDNP